MDKFYAKSTGGFYDSSIHAKMPSDAIKIAPDTYVALLSAQEKGDTIQPDAEGNPVAVASTAIAGNTDAPVRAQLALIDAKKIRAITDALISGDKTKLEQLEAQAALLRPHIKKG